MRKIILSQALGSASGIMRKKKKEPYDPIAIANSGYHRAPGQYQVFWVSMSPGLETAYFKKAQQILYVCIADLGRLMVHCMT